MGSICTFCHRIKGSVTLDFLDQAFHESVPPPTPRGPWAPEYPTGDISNFIYRRPTLYPLEIAVDFLKSL